MTEKPAASDLLGIAPLSEAINKVTSGIVDGAAAFLSRICLPAAEEFGLSLRDRVSHKRTLNAAKLAARAETILNARDDSSQQHAHPRIVTKIVEDGSWVDDDHVREMWSGLLAASCSHDQSDDGNLIFVDILSRITVSQALLLETICNRSEKYLLDSELLAGTEVHIPTAELVSVSGVEEINRIDRELDHLRNIGLIFGGFQGTSLEASVTPTTLGLQLYARTQGFAGDAAEFYGAKQDPTKPKPRTVLLASG